MRTSGNPRQRHRDAKPCGGLAISERPMALRTGLTAGVPFTSGTVLVVGSRAGKSNPDTMTEL
jgi:hypothetical protein